MSDDERDDAREPVPLSPGGDVPDTADELIGRWEQADRLEEVEIGLLVRSDITLADVGGMDAVKHQLRRSFFGPMQNPEMAAAFGKTAGGGLLLWGPPGCGKTFLARATAGELGANFYSVGLSDVLDMWIGSSERNLADIFEVARRNAPCVLFFDEIDALGQKRSHLRVAGAAMRGVVNQLLSELDGVDGGNDGVFTLAATNHPWDVDEALLRPGRFSERLLVLPPDAEARAAILALLLADRPTAGVDTTGIVAATEGWSGADLRQIVERAVEAQLDASMASGSIEPITTAVLHEALGELRPSIGAWVEAARNYVVYANRSGDYDELEAWLRQRDRG